MELVSRMGVLEIAGAEGTCEVGSEGQRAPWRNGGARVANYRHAPCRRQARGQAAQEPPHPRPRWPRSARPRPGQTRRRQRSEQYWRRIPGQTVRTSRTTPARAIHRARVTDETSGTGDRAGARAPPAPAAARASPSCAPRTPGSVAPVRPPSRMPWQSLRLCLRARGRQRVRNWRQGSPGRKSWPRGTCNVRGATARARVRERERCVRGGLGVARQGLHLEAYS